MVVFAVCHGDGGTGFVVFASIHGDGGTGFVVFARDGAAVTETLRIAVAVTSTKSTSARTFNHRFMSTPPRARVNPGGVYVVEFH